MLTKNDFFPIILFSSNFSSSKGKEPLNKKYNIIPID